MSQPDLWTAVCQNQGLISNAVEETLRFDNSVIAWRRNSTQPIEINGVSIPAGARVLILLGSANHDEAQFLEPEQFDLYRANVSNHLAFGLGIHYCLGAPLARLEATISLEQLTTRLPKMRLEPDQQIEFVPNLSFRGPKQLLVAWES